METARERRQQILNTLDGEDSFIDALAFSCFSRDELVSLLNDADRLAAIERDVGLLEDELRKFAPGKADVLFIVSRLRAILDPEK